MSKDPKSKQIVEEMIEQGLLNSENRERALSVVAEKLGEPIQAVRQQVSKALSREEQTESSPEVDESVLIEKAFEQGRSVIDAFHSNAVTQGRTNRAGSHKLIDSREHGRPKQALFTRLPSKEFAFGNDIMTATHNSDIRAATTLYPLENNIEKYQPDSPNAQERAYGIYFHVTELKGEMVREEQYIQPDGNRNGGVFTGCIVLPESTAKEIFSQVRQNPELLWKLFRKFDPNVMSEQERIMPETIDQVFVMPEEKQDDAYEGPKMGSRKFNNKYVLQLADRKSIT